MGIMRSLECRVMRDSAFQRGEWVAMDGSGVISCDGLGCVGV